MPKNITFTIDGQKYTLEFTAASICAMEQAGFNKNFLETVENHPFSVALTLLEGAFIAHHSDLTMDEIHELVSHLGNKEKLFQCLVVMFNEAVQRMIDDTGDTEWTFSETHPAVPSKLYKSIKS